MKLGKITEYKISTTLTPKINFLYTQCLYGFLHRGIIKVLKLLRCNFRDTKLIL